MTKEEVVAEALMTPGGIRRLAVAMSRPVPRCPVCDQSYGDFIAHCDMAGDPEHLAASVMEA